MLKRVLTAIRRRFFPATRDGAFSPVRRGLLVKATLGAASATGATLAARAAVDPVPHPERAELYRRSGRAGEAELLGREYVVMTEQEKAEIVQEFVESYADGRRGDGRQS